MDGEVWHLVEGRRDDGAPAIFRIRELAPRLELPCIFVVEMPYPITEMSHLPNAAAYRRLAIFEEQWVVPACAATGYELVGVKIEEGSFFLYMYGARDPNELISRLAPFDGALGFYDDQDPSWAEYATLKDLLDQAKAMPAEPAAEPEPPPVRSRAATITGIPPGPKPAATTMELQKPAVAGASNKRGGKQQSGAARKSAGAAKPAGAKKRTATKKATAKNTAAAKKIAGTKKLSAAKKPAAAKRTAKKRTAKKRTAKKPVAGSRRR